MALIELIKVRDNPRASNSNKTLTSTVALILSKASTLATPLNSLLLNLSFLPKFFLILLFSFLLVAISFSSNLLEIGTLTNDPIPAPSKSDARATINSSKINYLSLFHTNCS